MVTRSFSLPVILIPAFLGLGTILAGLPIAGPKSQPEAAGSREARQALAAMPIIFEQNIGQSGSQVQFVARGQDYTLGLNGGESRLLLKRPQSHSERRTEFTRTPPQTSTPRSEISQLAMRLVGSNPKAKNVGEKRLKAKINYLIGNNRKVWKASVPAYEQVGTKDVYPGIDLVHYGKATGALDYHLVVAPNADPGRIQLAIEGAEGMRVSVEGDLDIRTAVGSIRQRKPVCYQESGGVRTPVAGAFELAEGRIGFKLTEYDRNRPLVIDPVLTYSTYLGGGDSDDAEDVAVEDTDLAYVVGSTLSTDFPTSPDPFDTDFGDSNYDGYLTILDPTQTGTASLLFSTCIAGSSEDKMTGVAVNSSGKAFVVGYSDSSEMPTTRGAIQFGAPGGDAYLACLDTRCGAVSAKPPYLGSVMNSKT